MDKIKIDDLEIFARHGVLQEEKNAGQNFYVSIEMETDTRPAGLLDSLDDTVNYDEVAHLVYDVMTGEIYDLIETCAEKIAKAILLSTDKVKAVKVTISKPSAPIALTFKTVKVEIKRKWHDVYVAVGSNLGDSKAIIAEGLKALAEAEDVRMIKESSLIETKPYGVLDQPDFVNGAVHIKTLLTPYELLDLLHKIEADAKRERIKRWGPRTLDLDIILYDDLIMEEDDLCIPHVDMKNRDFVLKPMAEIAPYKLHPVYKKRMVELLAELEK